MDPRLILLVVIYLICAAVATFAIQSTQHWLQRRREWMERRLKGKTADEKPVLAISREQVVRSGSTGRLDRWFQQLVLESGVRSTPETVFLMTMVVVSLAGGVVLLWRDDFLQSASASLVAGIVVPLYLIYRGRKRRIAAQEQLPDVMELLARAVRAGETIDQAIDLVGTTVAMPLGEEFRRCARQLEMGLSVDSSLGALARRIPISEMRILAMTLSVQRQTGGNLPTTLDRLSHVIRDRINYHRQFRAATGAGRVSTILIGGAAPVVAIYLLVWQREYFDRFSETLPGQVLLGTAIALQVIGLIWIYLILRSDY